MAQSKLELLLELKNRMFNKALATTQKRYSSAMGKMKGKLASFKAGHLKAFSAMKDQFPGVGRGMDLITNKYVLMAAAAAGIIFVLAGATKKAIAFNHEFLQIETLNLGKTQKEFEKYKDTIRDTAFSVGTDLNKTAKAYYDVQSATGAYGDTAKKIVTEVGKYSIATTADLNDSINQTTKAMKAFGIGADGIKGYLESNAKTVLVGITTFKDLARVQTEYAGAAAGAGQTVNTANKIFAAFTSIAKDSRTAATMTKTAFMGLTQASTIKGLSSIGISMYDAKGNMRDLSVVLGEVAGKFKKMSPKQIDVLINKIGGPEGLRNLFVKLKTGSADFFKTLTDFDANEFDLDKALKNAQGDVTVLTNIVKNRWGVVMENLGQKILPMVATALNWINTAIVKGFAFYKEYSSAIDSMVGAVLTIIVALKAWAIAQSIINVLLSDNPIGAIIMGIFALVSAILWLKNNVEGWGAQWESVVGSMSAELDAYKYEALAGFGTLGHGFSIMVDSFVLAWKWGMNLIGQLSDKQYAKDKARIAKERKMRWKAIEDNALLAIKAKKKSMDLLQWKLKWKNEEEEEEASAVPGGGVGIGGAAAAAQAAQAAAAAAASDKVSAVTGAGAAVKNITINIDALNKGGINTANTVIAKMNKEEIEKWMEESFLRVVRNAELT